MMFCPTKTIILSANETSKIISVMKETISVLRTVETDLTDVPGEIEDEIDVQIDYLVKMTTLLEEKLK